ncbi:hypothetical protein JAO78_004905 [Alishewanella sp. 16-MA]|uniref:Uncharacterized protein n=1 Tax=Alishewanella maricola TaxID=2795740 RepID=A0ABS8C1G7_9ALTE|nr:hypothetical protein [Alishewanella maricola]MCB5226150.1 hypothetical protein [Alishewanella maricola]
MSIARTLEQIQLEIAVATSLEEKYGTNSPNKTYEQGVVDALLWVLGRAEPHSVEAQMELTKEDEALLSNWVAGNVRAEKIPETPLVDAEYENDRLLLLAHESPTLAEMVRDTLNEMDSYQEPHHAIWLGSFEVSRPRTQVQLVITQNPELWIDEE